MENRRERETRHYMFFQNRECEMFPCHTGVPEERASVILKQFCGVGGCSSLTAHLAEGDMDIYECAGDGTVLSVLALAYDKMCGEACYEYNFNSECKMIGGK